MSSTLRFILPALSEVEGPSSSANILKLTSFSAINAASLSLSAFPMPKYTSNPLPIRPTTCPSTSTVALDTLCMTARIPADYSRQSNPTKPPAFRILETSRRTEIFCGIGRRGRKKARSLLEDVPLKGQTSPTMERTHLCPRCTKLLIKDYYACPDCSLEFKKKPLTTELSMFFRAAAIFTHGTQ